MRSSMGFIIESFLVFQWVSDGIREPTLVHGKVKFAYACAVVHYSCAKDERSGEHRESLELLGFPIPASLRVTGFDKSLTSVGIERREWRGRKDVILHAKLNPFLHNVVELHSQFDALSALGSLQRPKFLECDSRLYQRNNSEES